MGCDQNKFNLGIRNILLGKDTAQKTCIFAKADVDTSLAGKFFVLHEPVTQAKHVFWYEVLDGVTPVGVAPTVSDSILHKITVDKDDPATAVATATQLVINALAPFNATVMGKEVEVTNAAFGYAYEGRDALDSLLKTKFNITTPVFGSVQADLGATNGDITFTLEEIFKDIKAPQFGDFVLGEIRRGASVSVAFELKDTSPDAIRRAINFYGSTIVTDDVTSSVLSGYGSSNLFKSTEDIATQLILRPTDKAVDEDASEDLTIHKAKLKLGELTMSAENELVLPIEVTAYLDTSKSAFANLFAYGDSTNLPVA